MVEHRSSERSPQSKQSPLTSPSPQLSLPPRPSRQSTQSRCRNRKTYERPTACSIRSRSLPTWLHRSMIGAISIRFPAKSAFLNCIRSTSFPASVRACSQVNPHHRATFPLVGGFSPTHEMKRLPPRGKSAPYARQFR